MQPNNPNQQPLPPTPPQQPGGQPVPPFSSYQSPNPSSDLHATPAPSFTTPSQPVAQPVAQPTQPTIPQAQPPQSTQSQPNFYGTQVAYQPPSQQQSTAPLPAPEPVQGPIALTLPMWIRDHAKILILSILGVIILGQIIFQIVYPSSRLLPGTVVDGVPLGGMRKQDAVAQLNKAYGEMKLAIYFGSNQAAFQTPKFSDIGIGVDTTAHIEPFAYPWYLRVVPTSYFWAGGLNKPGELEYVYDKQKINSYIEAQVGDDCTVPAKNASLKLVGEKLQLVPSQPGGLCDITRFQQVLAETKPQAMGENKVNIDIRETAAYVDDDKAKLVMDALNDRTSAPMPITVQSESQTIAGKTVLGWLDFKSVIPETPAGQAPDEDKIRGGSKLVFTVNTDRMGVYMAGDIAKKVVVKAGVNKVSTTDFTETSRVNGQPGRDLDKEKTAASVENYLNKKTNNSVAEAKAIAPSTVYTRKYNPTNTGFAALLAQWQQEHQGTYAVSFVELSGSKPFRSANFRGGELMAGAGIEGGYAAYAMLMGLSDNTILSGDKIAGDRNPDACLKDMIEKTDLECVKGFMTKIGHETMVRRGGELGLKSTQFGVTDTKTSANDLTTFLQLAFSNKLAVQANGGRILGTMKTTRLDEGIKAGILKGSVSNLAGDSGTVHNDAGVVYSPKGTYVLAIMTDGASWSDIAELTKKIEALHQVAPPKK